MSVPPDSSTPQTGLKGWMGHLLPVVREGGPITLLIVLLLGGLTLWFLNSQLTRQQDLTTDLVRQLLAEKDKRVELALRAAECGKTSATETKAAGLPYRPVPN